MHIHPAEGSQLSSCLKTIYNCIYIIIVITASLGVVACCWSCACACSASGLQYGAGLGILMPLAPRVHICAACMRGLRIRTYAQAVHVHVSPECTLAEHMHHEIFCFNCKSGTIEHEYSTIDASQYDCAVILQFDIVSFKDYPRPRYICTCIFPSDHVHARPRRKVLAGLI